MNFFKLEQVPVPPPEAYDRPSPWSEGTIGAWVLERFARSVVWADDLGGLAQELRTSGVPLPGKLSIEQVADARAELDAAHAILLGFDRVELVHLMGTFTALRRQEETRYGGWLSAQRVLRSYDHLKAV